MNTLSVNLGHRSYDVLIGAGCLARVNDDISDASSFMLFDSNVAQYADGVYAEHRMPFDASEQTKTMLSIEQICQTMRASGIDRSSTMIAMGGGVTGDVGGFAAASYMRGIKCIQIPTTLLAMVDASVGGKTGVNMKSESGSLYKNMIGAFWQPSLVVADVTTLKTLDARQLRCGVAECIKHALLGNDGLKALLQEHRDSILACDESTLIQLVTQSASVKKDVVEEDEREQGNRALLNLGHTFAHAIEPIEELDLYHGEAVAIGLCAAASLSEALGLIDPSRASDVRGMVSAFDLPTSLPIPQPLDVLLERMQSDKKHMGAKNRFIVLNDAGAEIAEDVSEALISLAWTSVGATRS